jgi:hypothetical protein
LAVKQIALSTLDNILPKIKVSIKSWWMTRRFNAITKDSKMSQDDKDVHYFVEKQLCLEEKPNVLVMNYSDIFVQMGYIMLFA